MSPRAFAAHRIYRQCCGSLADEPHDSDCREQADLVATMDALRTSLGGAPLEAAEDDSLELPECGDCHVPAGELVDGRCLPCARDHRDGLAADAGGERGER